MNGLLFVTVMSAALYCNAVPVNDPAYFRGREEWHSEAACPSTTNPKDMRYVPLVCRSMKDLFGVSVLSGQHDDNGNSQGFSVTGSLFTLNGTSENCQLNTVSGQIESAKLLFSGVGTSKERIEGRYVRLTGRMNFEWNRPGNDRQSYIGYAEFSGNCKTPTGQGYKRLHAVDLTSVKGTATFEMVLNYKTGQPELGNVKIDITFDGRHNNTVLSDSPSGSPTQLHECDETLVKGQAVTREGTFRLPEEKLARFNENLNNLTDDETGDFLSELLTC